MRMQNWMPKILTLFYYGYKRTPNTQRKRLISLIRSSPKCTSRIALFFYEISFKALTVSPTSDGLFIFHMKNLNSCSSLHHWIQELAWPRFSFLLDAHAEPFETYIPWSLNMATMSIALYPWNDMQYVRRTLGWSIIRTPDRFSFKTATQLFLMESMLQYCCLVLFRYSQCLSQSYYSGHILCSSSNQRSLATSAYLESPCQYLFLQ